MRSSTVTFGCDSGATVTTELVETLPVKTSKLGATRVTWRPEKAGQYQFTFVAKDSWGGEVKKSTVAWVVGPEWNGRSYRFNGLEVLTDKRELPDLLGRFGVTDVPTGLSGLGKRSRAYVKVQDGCLLRCSFCVIPHVRPNLASRPMEHVVNEVRGLVAHLGRLPGAVVLCVGHGGRNGIRTLSAVQRFRGCGLPGDRIGAWLVACRSA